jgi:hypothetical protein
MNVRWWLVAVPAIGLGLVWAVADTPTPTRGADDGPQYDGKNLLRPDGYRTWVFVGANIGLRYRKDDALTTPRETDRHAKDTIGDFHNVYINPKGYEQFQKTGRFPEGTVLVMDVYRAQDREPKNIVEGGFFPGDQREIEVAVKDSKRPDGAKEDWAYYIFPLDKKTAAAMPKAACYDCHLKHASVDNVWVQFYPTLRGLKK